MIFSFKMKLKPGNREEYKRRHQNIWPELEKLLSNSGIREYSIWLDQETDTLFAIQQLPDDFDNKELASNHLMKKWWKYMEDIMETNEDSSPVVVPLEEMYYLK
jgi:L-rhamnose mutarotase